MSFNKEVEEYFYDWIDSSDYTYEDTLLEFQEYDAKTKQVFIRAEGTWNEEIKRHIRDVMRNKHKRITVSRIYNLYD